MYGMPTTPKSFYISNSELVKSGEGYEIYKDINSEKIGYKFFKGRAKKPVYNYSFRSEEQANKFIESFIYSVESSIKSKKKRLEERKETKRELEVGDIVYTSWGYDQTNINFYQITALVGKKSVKYRKIGQMTEQTGYTNGVCVPVPDSFYENYPEKTARVNGVCLTVDNYFARPVSFQMIAGKKIFKELNYSWGC